MMTIDIREGDLDDPQVVELLVHHLERARGETAPGSAHALDHGALKGPDVDFLTMWDDETLVGMGAVKRLDARSFEVKSMHTVSRLRGRGLGGQMLNHLCDSAAARGATRISLETGSWDYFKPAVALYRRHGFETCAPFADYVEDPNSIFMTKVLR